MIDFITWVFIVWIITEILSQGFLCIFNPELLYKLQGRYSCPITLAIVGGIIATSIAAAASAAAASAVAVGGALIGGLGALGGLVGATGTMGVLAGGSMVAGVASAGVGATAAIMEGQSAKASADYNAKMMEYNANVVNMEAQQTQKKGDLELSQQKAKVLGLIGSQRASYGASGAVVDTGSPLATAENTEYLGGQDAITIQHNTAMDVWGKKRQIDIFNSKASMFKSDGKNAVTQSYFKAGESILSGVSQAASMGMKMGS